MSIVELCVHMDCSGCESKIRKAISKLRGVDGVEIDMERQKVTVTGTVEQKKVLKAVRRTGRRAVLWPYPLAAEPDKCIYTQEYYRLHQGTPAPHHLIFNVDPESYNYCMHGYGDSSMHGYYQDSTHTHIISDEDRARYSDDNPNACSVM
ncbi:heavy metal-associated isoprenylated plant protein 28-like [Zingiber officinale]|uniref:heavy metal-associated isoprenylated plant protein 28-like n=1 Tax=Zingiber officinale TaxID=94328 RepID=UPI001C4CCDDA|nr:heavy metal-associated isoprenylated plant protein 28-like [Zingiber officinale]XP_042386330.1 heavy metal-associated isoprenylated plant protein 28-like [Zingiber officinale]